MDRYLNTLRDQNIRLPTSKTLNVKVADINKLLNRTWTDEDISAKISKQKAIQTKHDPANAANLARQRLLARKARAEEEQDYEEVARCNAELQATESNAGANTVNGVAAGRSPAKPIKTGGVITEQERLAQRNAMTRKTNAEEVRKALLEERRKELAGREKAFAEAKAKAKAKAEADAQRLKVPASDMVDLFGEGSDISRAGTPVNGLKKAAKSGRSRSSTPLVQRPLGALISTQKNDDDVIGAMDLGIDIDI